jgi:hypothetical protein
MDRYISQKERNWSRLRDLSAFLMKGSAASQLMPHLLLAFIINTNIHGNVNKNTLGMQHGMNIRVTLPSFSLDSQPKPRTNNARYAHTHTRGSARSGRGELTARVVVPETVKQNNMKTNSMALVCERTIPSDRSLSAKLVPTFAVVACRVVSSTYPQAVLSVF